MTSRAATPFPVALLHSSGMSSRQCDLGFRSPDGPRASSNRGMESGRRLVGGAFALACALMSACALPPASGNAKAQLEDLAAFEQGFFLRDRSYSAPARAEAARRIADLKSSAGSISDTRFILLLSQIAALADNGHTGVMYRGSAPGLGRVGLRLAPLGSEFIVVHALEENASLLGSRLVAIDDVPVARLRSVAHTLQGGVLSRRDLMAPAFLESPGELHSFGLSRSADHATYVFETRDGRRRAASLAATSPAGGSLEATMAQLSPASAPAGWRSLLTAEKAPWVFQDIGETMRRRDAPEFDAMIVQLRANLDGTQRIADFLQESEDARRRAGRRNAILDMRMNGGGDLTTTREWMSALPRRLPPEGRVIVLIGPSTFSAAISSVGYLKQAGGSRVVLVGEPVGDRLEFFAEGQPITLPNSGAVVLMATERHDYVNGCRAFVDCHRFVVRYPSRCPTSTPRSRRL